MLTVAETTPVVCLWHFALLVLLYEGPSTTLSSKLYDFAVGWCKFSLLPRLDSETAKVMGLRFSSHVAHTPPYDKINMGN